MQLPQGRRRGKAAEELILRTVAANADSLLRTARRHSLCLDDAQDAYQRALEIFMVHAERLDGGNAAGWLQVVVKREAQAVRASRQKLVSPEDLNLDEHEARSLPTPDERLAAFDLVGRAAEALQRLKPQELRALWLKAEGHSYNEIAELTGWSYTKVNRCLTEGRRSFLARYATIESGAECERWLPILSAMVDGETTPEQLIELRPHLRNCPGCRATLATLRGSSEPLAMVLPIPLVAAVGVVGDQVASLVERGYEMVVGGLHERAIHSFMKAQSVFEAASTGKLAAAAASAAAVVGGSYATVEHKVPASSQHKPAKESSRMVERDRRQLTAADTAAPKSARKVPSSARSDRHVGEFQAPANGARAPEFAPPHGLSRQYSHASVGELNIPPPDLAVPHARSAPEFAAPESAPEFGG